jgi:hypothetical protein
MSVWRAEAEKAYRTWLTSLLVRSLLTLAEPEKVTGVDRVLQHLIRISLRFVF